MKKINITSLSLVIVLLITSFNLVSAQVLEPVKWSFSGSMMENGNVSLALDCKIDEGWHVYSIQPSDDPEVFGPMPTEIIWEASEAYRLLGKLQEGEPIKHYDPNFEVDLNYFEKEAHFTQLLELKGDLPLNIKGELNFMACDDEKCIFPDPVPLYISLSAEGKVEVNKTATSSTSSQKSGIYEPAKWSFAALDLGDGTHELQMTCTLDDGWHVYSQHLSSLEGPLPTMFLFELPEGASLIDSVLEQEPHIEYDPNFMMDLAYFDTKAVFRQQVKAQSTDIIKGSVDFMVCNDERCLPPELIEFTFDLSTGKGMQLGIEGDEVQNVLDENAIIPQLPKVNLDQPASDCGGEVKDIKNTWMVFVFGFIGGLLALLTPCVFPMIPLTVSFFTKGNQSRSKGIAQALLYGFFIFLIYALLSIPFHFGTEPEVLNEIATGVTLNIIFFVVFVVFAISFFGFFEIQLPTGMVNKIDNASNVGGLIGIFLMALTLALVSFSCTGPILGTVLGNALKNGPWPITAAMSGFGIALGLPFAIFAMFPSMMKSLPKSGGWLNSVKVVLGFLELALALKFLSNADLVKQWGIIPREAFFLIWTIIFLGLALYLFGILKFPHDTKNKRVSPLGLGLGALVLAFTIYLAPGVLRNSPWNHDLLSGFPPPTFYSWYDQEAGSEDEQLMAGQDGEHQSDTFHPPFDDFEAARAEAKASGKPILIDFTGWACVNCRKMEESVWTEPVVLDKLRNDFVVVSLYVDDRTELPEDQQGVFEYEVNGEMKQKNIRTIGNKWATFQTKLFNNNSQPYYVMLSPEGELLANPVGYTPDVQEYTDYLDCGIQTNAKTASN
ncbi:MAG: protein-disulfide reductase DsbD family protein [Flavobacteriales bacterium]|nr:protein-disulfide reductase DsbD family protein [Flavobacteriales bacterium]